MGRTSRWWSLPGRLTAVLTLTLSLVGVGAVSLTPVLAAGAPLAESQWNTVGDKAALFFGKGTKVPLTLKRIIRAAGPGEIGKASAETWGLDISHLRDTSAPAVYCVILVKKEDASRGIIAHEVFHCLQLQLLGNDSTFERRGDYAWLGEGGAAFAACLFAGADTTDTEVKYDTINYLTWLVSPEKPLLDRVKPKTPNAYAGIGFWALLQKAKIDPLQAMVAAFKGTTPADAYSKAVGTQQQQVVDLWGSTVFREPARTSGKDWDVSGDCAPSALDTEPYVNTVIHKIGLARNGKVTQSAEPYAAKALTVSVDERGRVMHVVTSSGSVRVNGAGGDYKNVKNSYFCVKKGGCVCPRGMAFSKGPLLPLGPVHPVPALALAGGKAKTKVTISEVPFACKPASLHVIIKGAKAGYPQISFQIKGQAATVTSGGRKVPYGLVTQECPPKCDLSFTGTFKGTVLSDVMVRPQYKDFWDPYGFPYAVTSIAGCKLPPGPTSVGYIEENVYDGASGPCNVKSKSDITVTVTLEYLPYIAVVAGGSVNSADFQLSIGATSTGPLGDQNDSDSDCHASSGGPSPICAFHMYPGTEVTAGATGDIFSAVAGMGGPCAGQDTHPDKELCHFTVGKSDTLIPVTFMPACTGQFCNPVQAVNPNPLPPGFTG